MRGSIAWIARTSDKGYTNSTGLASGSLAVQNYYWFLHRRYRTMRLRQILPSSLLFFLPLLNAQPSDPLFASSEILDITLNAPFAEIDRQRDKSESYDGTLSYSDSQGNAVVLDAAFEVRGNWRLKRENCDHAQLWIDLKRGQTPGTLFENQNRLKLVVQCGRQDRKQQWIVKEQLAYDLFSAFSPLYFDTRLLNVSYIDSVKEDSQRSHMAFFIEHQNRLRDRFALEKVELNRVDSAKIDADQANAVALFMLMIGNTDFSLAQGPVGDECCHNAKLLSDAQENYFPFPYDFDSSGFVDTAYASPPLESMNIRNNKQRLYRGYCSHEASLNDAIAAVKATQSAVQEAVAQNEFLAERGKRIGIKYIEQFYEILSDERKIRREIFDDCR